MRHSHTLISNMVQYGGGDFQFDSSFRILLEYPTILILTPILNLILQPFIFNSLKTALISNTEMISA